VNTKLSCRYFSSHNGQKLWRRSALSSKHESRSARLYSNNDSNALSRQALEAHEPYSHPGYGINSLDHSGAVAKSILLRPATRTTRTDRHLPGIPRGGSLTRNLPSRTRTGSLWFAIEGELLGVPVGKTCCPQICSHHR